MKRVAVLISGSGSNLQALIDHCHLSDAPLEIVCVISNKADAYGLTRAQEAGIPTQIISHQDYPDRDAFDGAVHDALISCDAEIVCLAGFMRLLTPGFVEKWQGRMINIHPSLLPAFKGLHTHKSAIETGVKWAGCSVHFVSAEMDAGPIIVQAAVPVMDDDTEERLAARVLEQEHRIYPQALTWLAQGRLQIDGNRVTLKNAADCSAAFIHPALDKA